MYHSYKAANIKLFCSTKFSYKRSYDLALNILTFEQLCGKTNFSNTIITQSFHVYAGENPFGRFLPKLALCNYPTT